MDSIGLAKRICAYSDTVFFVYFEILTKPKSIILQKLLLSLILISTGLSAQVVGKVTGSNGEPLSYVNIYLRDTYTGTTTNEDGNYSLSINQPGEYQIVFQF